MSLSVRVRFAPSPTGYLHVGGARTALFNWLFARAQGGSFLLRIEDTDQTRYSPEALSDLIDDLRWLGLQWDEGEQVGGPHAPYTQSQRLPLYQQAAQTLLEQGNAYRCFCSAERLDQLRTHQQESGQPTGYDRHCRELSAQESQQRADAGELFVIRLKVPIDGETVFNDFLRGNISTPNATLDDMVLLKRDGFPTYHMANVVDDHDMKITHVMRGDEWIPSTSRHLLLYRAFGWEPPQFVHLPVILSPTGGKLSKRKGAASVGEFREMGYLPEALFNYLALLGWSPGDDRELMAQQEMIDAFTLERILAKSAVFDEVKLKWFNAETILKSEPAKLLPYFREAFAKAEIDLSGESDQRLIKIIEAVRPRVQLLPEFVAQSQWCFFAPNEYDPKAVNKAWKPGSDERVSLLIEALRSMPQEVSEEALDQLFQQLYSEHGFGPGQLMPVVRLALCGGLTGPAVSTMIVLVGLSQTIDRLEQVGQKLAQG